MVVGSNPTQAKFLWLFQRIHSGEYHIPLHNLNQLTTKATVFEILLYVVFCSTMSWCINQEKQAGYELT